MLTLKNVMRANAASCLIFGVVFTALASSVADFLGGSSPPPTLLIFALGIVLIINGIHLLWASNKTLPAKILVLYFSFGDFIWVIASLALIVFELWIVTSHGIIAALFVAAIVGFFGAAQMFLRKRQVRC